MDERIVTLRQALTHIADTTGDAIRAIDHENDGELLHALGQIQERSRRIEQLVTVMIAGRV